MVYSSGEQQHPRHAREPGRREWRAEPLFSDETSSQGRNSRRWPGQSWSGLIRVRVRVKVKLRVRVSAPASSTSMSVSARCWVNSLPKAASAAWAVSTSCSAAASLSRPSPGCRHSRSKSSTITLGDGRCPCSETSVCHGIGSQQSSQSAARHRLRLGVLVKHCAKCGSVRAFDEVWAVRQMAPCLHLFTGRGHGRRSRAAPPSRCAACDGNEEPKQGAWEGCIKTRCCGGVPRGTAGYTGAAGRLHIKSDLPRSASGQGTTTTTQCRQPNSRM